METIFILIIIFGLPALYLLVYGAPYAPIDRDGLERTCTYFREHDVSRAVDLGAGDGRVVIAFAREGIEAHGYELNPLLVGWAQFRIWWTGCGKNAHIHWKDMWSAPLESFDGVYVFGVPHIMGDLEALLAEEMQPGTPVVSFLYQFPTWEAEFVHENTRLYRVKNNDYTYEESI